MLDVNSNLNRKVERNLFENINKSNNIILDKTIGSSKKKRFKLHVKNKSTLEKHFNKNSILSENKRTKTNLTKFEKIECFICDEEFPHKNYLKNHICEKYQVKLS